MVLTWSGQIIGKNVGKLFQQIFIERIRDQNEKHNRRRDSHESMKVKLKQIEGSTKLNLQNCRLNKKTEMKNLTRSGSL